MRKKVEAKVQLTVRIAPDLAEKIFEVVEREKKSISAVVEDLLRKAVYACTQDN